MHSRKKTPKDESKEKEKLLKAQKFHAAMTKFLVLKNSGCKDRALLKDLGNLLRINPEFGTLWHYRKELLVAFKKSIDNGVLSQLSTPSPELKDSDGNTKTIDDKKQELWKEFDQLCINELAFIETCLHSNPKSYATWHHRVWLIQFMRNPDFKKEIQLCNQCLSWDERNFHCWNYRRFIVKLGQIQTIDEFKFTSRKIVDNFSNFSSWHYRSCLYRQMLSENYDQNELRLMVNQDLITVKNAIFTDPNDQSPWLYLRWLLKFENSLNTPQVSSKYKIKQYLWIKYPTLPNKEQYLFIIEFTDSYGELPALQLKIDNQIVTFQNWKLVSNGSIWLTIVENFHFQHLESTTCQHEFYTVFENEIIHQKFFCDNTTDSKNERTTCFIYHSENNHALEQEHLENVANRIKDLKVLLNIEANSKWPNYMLTILDPFMDCFDANLETLIKIDPLRTNYYYDLKNKKILEQKLFSSQVIKTLELINFPITSQTIPLQQ